MAEETQKGKLEREKLEALNKDADFGKLIPINDAESIIRHVHSDVGRWVLQGCNQNIDPDSKIAIRHHKKNGDYTCRDRTYIIGKSRIDRRIEITLRGGYTFGPYQMWPDLNIYLKYDGDDIGFQPKIIDPHEGDIPLKRGYGANITITKYPDPYIREEPIISDNRLNEQVDQLYRSIYEASDEKYLGLERGRGLGVDFSLEQLSEEARKITGLAEAIERQRNLKYGSPEFDWDDWNSSGDLIDLKLFPGQDIGVYVVSRYCQYDLSPNIMSEEDEVTVGILRKGKECKKTIKDKSRNFNDNLQSTRIRNVKIRDNNVVVDFLNRETRRFFSLDFK